MMSSAAPRSFPAAAHKSQLMQASFPAAAAAATTVANVDLLGLDLGVPTLSARLDNVSRALFMLKARLAAVDGADERAKLDAHLRTMLQQREQILCIAKELNSLRRGGGQAKESGSPATGASSSSSQ
jgi:hypothetical protein